MKYYKKPIFVEDYRADATSYENAERLTVFLNDAWAEDHNYDTKQVK